MIELLPGEIHIWLSYYDELDDKTHHASYRNLLDTVERRQELRFHFDRDRRRYLATRALVRATLSRYADVPPQDWMFVANEYGRPAIANENVRRLGIDFNISHTLGLIVLGVTKNCRLGIDVESTLSRAALLEIADRCFSPEEVSALARLPREMQHHRFFEYWTLKESYIKARGLGLSIPLDYFSFEFQGRNGVSISISTELGDSADRWRFWQFQLNNEYVVAVCAERCPSGGSMPTILKTVPLKGSDEKVEPEYFRFSK